MAASRTTSVEATVTTSRPSAWNRGPPQLQAKPSSVEPTEFVPKSFSTASKEFVPSWKKAQEEVAQVSSDDSTDDSSTDDSSDEENPFKRNSQAKEFVPKAFTAKCAEFVPKSFSAKSADFVSKALSADTPEFVPRGRQVATAPANCNAISFGAYSDCSDEETDDQARTLAPTNDACAEPAELKTKTLSSCTLSTCLGSPTADLSTDYVSSEGSETGTSRSHSPAPLCSAATFGVNDLLKWRHATPSNRPDGLLLVSEVVEPSTPEAAVDVAVASESEACAELSDATPLSDFFSAKKAGIKKKKQGAAASKESDKFVGPANEVEEVPMVEDVTASAKKVESQRLAAPGKEVSEVPVVQEARPAMEALPANVFPAAKTVTKTSRPVEEQCWRNVETVKPVVEEQCWRNVETVKKLEVSKASFAAQMRARRTARSGSDVDKMSDKDVVRAMKSILNKLTVEKFDSLSSQLMQCGISSASHVEQLIEEVFEKATTQHHFINMYADLCVLLSKQRIIEDTSINFKKILLNCCQASFEKNLTPPSGLAELNSEDRTTTELLYKMRMIGNIRFVGALLVRKMLASKVMLSIMEVLLQDPTPEALESLAAFLMVVGPSFDTADWAYSATLNAVFAQIGKLIKKGAVPSRVKCLLKDVIDIRNLGWKDMRPKKIEGPLKLDQVAAKAAVELSGGKWDDKKQSSTGDDWSFVSGARKASSLSSMSTPPCTPASQKAENLSKTSDLFKKLRDKEELSKREEAVKKEAKKEKKEKKEAKREAAQFDKEAWRAELSSTLDELRVSHEVPDAIARIADISVPPSQQPSELCEILSRITEEGSREVRRLGFQLAAGLFLEKHWMPESAVQGLRTFMEEICPDLKCDVPALPHILRDELQLAFSPLSKANSLDMEQLISLTNIC